MMFLLLLLTATVITAAADNRINKEAPRSKLLQLGVYYETLCPDSQEFVLRQLTPTYKKLSEIVNITLVPYGNARVTRGRLGWLFNCQHGHRECFGNIIQTCAIYLNRNMSLTMSFIRCMFLSEEPPTAGPSCARQLGLNWRVIRNCVRSPLGNNLEYKMAVATMSLKPPHTYVPWITINGVHTDKMQKEAEVDLFHLLCRMYKGKPPDVCNEEKVPDCHINQVDNGFSYYTLPLSISQNLL